MHYGQLLVFAYLAIVGSCSGTPDVPYTTAPAIAPVTTRAQFALAMAGIRPGMLEGQVQVLLGPPHDIRMKSDLREGYPTRVAKIWCYGTSGHLTFPTLGQVYIDRAGKVDYVAGNQGSPPDSLLISEKRLRHLLQLLDRAPAAKGLTYDPREMIKIVNALVPLGKERALAVISEYLRISPESHSDAREGMYLVPLVLFEVPSSPGFFPRPLLGNTSPEEPRDQKVLPRYPMIVVDDVPLLLVSDYTMLGARAAIPNLEYFRTKCRLRSKPLRPTSEPFSIPQKLMDSKQWIYSSEPGSAASNSGKVLLINQLLRLVKPVYRSNIDFGEYEGCEGLEVNRLWGEQVKRLMKLRIVWDAESNEYVLSATRRQEFKKAEQ
jgi:hypothetical protein